LPRSQSRIDEAAKKVKIIGIESAADTKAMTSLPGDRQCECGSPRADALAGAITTSYADNRRRYVMITSMPGVASLDQRARGFKEAVRCEIFGHWISLADKVGDGKPGDCPQHNEGPIANNSGPARRVVSDPITTLAVAKPWSKRNRTTDQCRRLWLGRKARQTSAGRRDRRTRRGDPFRMVMTGRQAALAASKGEQVAANVEYRGDLVTKPT